MLNYQRVGIFPQSFTMFTYFTFSSVCNISQYGVGTKGPNISRYFSWFESLRAHSGNRKEASLLGPTKSRPVSNLAVLGLKLGWTGAQLGPNLRRTRASWPQVEPNWARLDASWAQHAQLGSVWGHLATKLGPRQAQCAWPCTNPSKIMKVKKRWK